MRVYDLYKDELHGFTAAAPSISMAWALIRNKCHQEKIQVPTMDKIIFIRKLSEEETQKLKTKQ